jgi:hypothetical protein
MCQKTANFDFSLGNPDPGLKGALKAKLNNRIDFEAGTDTPE